MVMTSCIPFLIRIEKVGCGSKEGDIKAGNVDGSY
jgi:hypothetical protein